MDEFESIDRVERRRDGGRCIDVRAIAALRTYTA